MIKKKYIQYIQYAAARPLFLGMLCILILAGSFPIFNIHVDSTGEGWFPKNSQQLIVKNQFRADFGGDELMMLYLTFPDSCSKQYRVNTLKKINDTISRSVYGFENVFSRFSTSNVGEVMGENYAKRLEQHYFQSNDSSGEMLFLKVRLNKDINSTRPLLIDSLKDILKGALARDIKIHLSGPSVVFNEIDKLSTKDSGKLFGISFVLIFALLAWQVRRGKYLLICFALVLLSLIPSISLFGWLDIPLNMITMTIPLLFAINFYSFVIHIITKQSTNIEFYLNKKIPPIITSALATIIGFGSLTSSNIKLISQFGLLTSLGIIAGLFILLLVGVPLVVRLIDVNELVVKPNWLNRFLDRYYEKITRPVSLLILVFMAMIIGVSMFLFPKINTDTNMINAMKPNNEVRQTTEYIEKHYGAANVVDFLIIKKNNQPLNNIDFKMVAETNKQIAMLSFVKSAVGFDIWRPFINRISATNPTLANQLTNNFLSKDRCRSRMMVNIPSGSVREMDFMLRAIQNKIDHLLLGSDMEIRPVGFLPVYIEQMTTIVDGMLYGLAIAVVLILIVMIVLVRDLKLGLITALVTAFPLCGLAILMKFLDISFDVGTSIISSVAIGMIADDALHIIWNYKRYLLRKQVNQPAVNILFADAVRKIVFPCTMTSIMFSIGFSVLMFSKMQTIANFGILSAAIILFAWVSDFIFFPALLKICYPKNDN